MEDMKSGLLKRTVSELTQIPLGTAADRVKELQTCCMLTKGERGRHGGAILTATDRINALLACLFDSAENVTRVRRLDLSLAYYNPLGQKLSVEDNARCAFQVVEGLGIRFDDLGIALDSIVQSMRCGAFEKWAAGGAVSVSVDLRGKYHAMLAFDRPQANVSAIFEFSTEPAMAELPIDRFTRLNTAGFERLAVDVPS